MKTNARNFYTGINRYLSGYPIYHPLPEKIAVTDPLTYSHINSLPLITDRLNILRHYRMLQPIMAHPVIWQDQSLDRYLVTESTAKKEIIDNLFTGNWQPRTKQKPLSTSH
jgi:hypothetical protein